MNIEASKVVADILENQLSLTPDQVWVTDQNRDIPKDNRLFVVVGNVSSEILFSNSSVVNSVLSISKVGTVTGTDLSLPQFLHASGTTLKSGVLTTPDLFSNLTGLEGVSDGQIAVSLNSIVTEFSSLNFNGQTTINGIATVLDSALLTADVLVSSEGNFINFQDLQNRIFEDQGIVSSESLQIDILSRTNSARDSRYSVLLALTSLFSNQKQEENGFRIFRIPTSFINNSVLEGGSKITRYTIRVNCYVGQSQRKEIVQTGGTRNVYEVFPLRVDDEESIETSTGIIEINNVAPVP